MQKKLDPNKILDYYVDWCADQGKITVTQNINKSDECAEIKEKMNDFLKISVSNDLTSNISRFRVYICRV